MKDSKYFKGIAAAIAVLTIIIGGSAIYVVQIESQPTVTFEPQVVPPSQRTDGNFVVRVKIKTSQTLKNACINFKEMYSSGWKAPIDVSGRIGWYLGGPSWTCQNISEEEAFLLFVVRGNKLELFVRNIDGSDGIPSELLPLREIVPGDYRIRILLQADNLKNGVSQVYNFRWDGRTPWGFVMTPAGG